MLHTLTGGTDADMHTRAYILFVLWNLYLAKSSRSKRTQIFLTISGLGTPEITGDRVEVKNKPQICSNGDTNGKQKMQFTKKEDKNGAYYSLRLSPDLYEKLKTLSYQKRKPMSVLIIEAVVEKYELDEKVENGK